MHYLAEQWQALIPGTSALVIPARIIWALTRANIPLRNKQHRRSDAVLVTDVSATPTTVLSVPSPVARLHSSSHLFLSWTTLLNTYTTLLYTYKTFTDFSRPSLM